MKKSLKNAVFATYLGMLRPVARLLIRCGISWKELAELTKMAIVGAAADEFGLHGRPASTSRIALATGLGRREVKRLRDVLAAPSGVDASERLGTVDQASSVLSAWHRDKRFRTRSGKPRLLAPEGETGFEGLAKSVLPDIPPTAVLRELKKAGAVQETPAGKLKVVKRYYMPVQMDSQQIVRSSDVLGDFSQTVVHNLFADDGKTRFEGRATSLNVRPRAVASFQAFLERQAMAFLTEADEWLGDREVDDTEPGVRLGVGIYMIKGKP